MPMDEEVGEFKSAIVAKYSAHPKCWDATAGLKLRLERAGDKTMQNNFYKMES
jgi:hypothetical protein